MKQFNKNNKSFHTFCLALALALPVAFTACDDENLGDTEVANAPYVVSLGITSSGTTTYYVVTVENLMEGTINAIGKGLEENGYHDYMQANQTVFSIGGMGVTNAVGIVRNANGLLEQKGQFVFNAAPDAITQLDDDTMLALELPATKESGSLMTFYTVGIDDVSIGTKTSTSPVAPMANLDWPSVSGMAYSEGNIYVTYFPMNPNTFATAYTDTTYVAVYEYPSMAYKKIMKDTRTGPAGSWNAFNGIFKVENGDMYIMSNSALSNGFSQSTKNAGFLRIPAGATEFDADYHFDFGAATGGLRPAHVQYVGNGIVYAEVSTINPQTAADRWGDKSLKCCLIDLYNQTVTDVEGIPVHDGNGGRRFSALVEGNYVYQPVATGEGNYMYRTDIRSAQAERGAKISTTFVGGLFKLNQAF